MPNREMAGAATNCPPSWPAESRLAKIREAKAALAKLTEREQQARETGRTPTGRPPTVPDPTTATPRPKAQRNFTDPESWIMKDGATKSFVQAYNAQAAVDGQAQIIVAATVTQEANDTAQLVPMLQSVEANLHRKPTQVSADAGYFSAPQVTDPAVQNIDLYVPPDRQHHGEAFPSDSDPPPPDAPVIAQMRHKLQTVAGQAIYALRKAIVEPVFGQIKAGLGFRRFAFRGQATVLAVVVTLSGGFMGVQQVQAHGGTRAWFTRASTVGAAPFRSSLRTERVVGTGRPRTGRLQDLKARRVFKVRPDLKGYKAPPVPRV